MLIRQLAKKLCLFGVGTFIAMGAVFFFAQPASASDVDFANLSNKQQAKWGLERRGYSRSVNTWNSKGWALAEVGEHVYVGGTFLEVTNGTEVVSQPYLARFNTKTSELDKTFRPVFNGVVLTLEEAPDGTLLVGGEFDRLDGEYVGALVKLDPTTVDVAPGWNTKVFGGFRVVRTATIEVDGNLYVGGNFSGAWDPSGSMSAKGIIRMNPTTGKIDRSWRPTISYIRSIKGIAVSHTRDHVYIASTATAANLTVVAVSKTDGNRVQWSGFRPNNEYKLVSYDVETTEFGTVFLAGEQHAMYVLDERDMSQIQYHYTTFDSRLQNNATADGGDFQAVTRVGDYIVASCHCFGSMASETGMTLPLTRNLASQYPLSQVTDIDSTAAFDPKTGKRLRSFSPEMAGLDGGWANLGTSDGCLWMAGSYSLAGPAGNKKPARDLVRLCQAGVDPSDIDPPASCQATLRGGEVYVNWPQIDQADFTEFVVRRSVDDSRATWRGSTSNFWFSEASYNDPAFSGDVKYYVQTRLGDAVSELTSCDYNVQIEAGPAAPAQCSFGDFPGGKIRVSWTTGFGADSYIIRRSVDGSKAYWRAKQSADLDLDWDDVDGAPANTVYYVQAVYPGHTLSELTECVDKGYTPLGGNTAPAQCSFGDFPGGKIRISWTPGFGAKSFIIRRSVDGADPVWRARQSTELDFEWDDSEGAPANTVYYVQSVFPGYSLSDLTECTNKGYTPIGNTISPPASCEFSPAADGGVKVTWELATGAKSYIVRRSIDGGKAEWRTRQFNGTEWVDPVALPAGAAYHVQAVYSGYTVTEATDCTQQ